MKQNSDLTCELELRFKRSLVGCLSFDANITMSKLEIE